MIISAIAAVADNGTIGKHGGLPWHLPDDMKFFQRTTVNHHVITGRKNYESIPERFRPLPNRTNIVVTRADGYKAPGAFVCRSLEEAIDLARNAGETECFIIGGGQVYEEAFRKKLILEDNPMSALISGSGGFPPIPPDEWIATIVRLMGDLSVEERRAA